MVLFNSSQELIFPQSLSDIFARKVQTFTVLYIRDHEGLDFSGKNITQKPASQLHPGTLAVLVRYNQAQKYLQYDPKGFLKMNNLNSFRFL